MLLSWSKGGQKFSKLGYRATSLCRKHCSVSALGSEVIKKFLIRVFVLPPL